MPRGPAPGWRSRKPPISDDYILAVVSKAGGPGKHHPETGCYGTLYIRGLTSRDEAMEWKRSLFRCAHWLSRNKVADVSVSPEITRTGSRYEIRFSVYDKTIARGHVLDKHGPDRSKWPYDPRRKGQTP